jgi:predicted DNA binding CopG/RHH family protein
MSKRLKPKGRHDKDLLARIPEFKSEKQEAEWWDTNETLIYELMKKHGRLVGPLTTVRSTPPTRPVTLRVSEDDIAHAREIAVQRGIGYQTVLKQAIREGLSRADATTRKRRDPRRG